MNFKITENIKDLKIKSEAIPLFKVESSNIQAIGYRSSILYVAFNTGIVYEYNNVPLGIVSGLFSAKSKGKYFNLFIRKGGYPYEKVGEIEKPQK